MSLKSNDPRALLLTAAARTVSKYGVDVSVSRIARAAVVDDATLFKHFVSKEAFLNSFYLDIHCDLCSKLRECVVPGEPLPEGARAIWNLYIDLGPCPSQVPGGPPSTDGERADAENRSPAISGYWRSESR